MKNIENVLKIDKLHPYPAKYTVDMVEKYIQKYTNENDTIMDPFVGSGTTLLAAKYMNRKSYGFDINPIAFIISKVKSNNYNINDKVALELFISIINDFFKNIDNEKFEYVYYETINHWFKDFVIKALSAIRHCINLYSSNEKMRDLYYMTMSNIIITVSNQESDTRYSAKDKNNIKTYNDVLSLFEKKLNISFSLLIKDDLNNINTKVFLKDSNLINKTLKKGSIDLLITSPPYPNTYDYYLYHKHRMLWLGYDFKPVMVSEIGSRREFSSLKKEGSKFLDDLYSILKSADYSLKKGAYIVIIIGDGKISGEIYDSKETTIKIANRLNWKIVEESYTELDSTSKSFQKSFRTKGKKEHFLVFQKED